MSNTDQSLAEQEIERLRKALDAETQRCLDIQKRLDRASADFEDFVSRAAHDLRASLRDVASFSQLMAETYSNHLDSDAAMYLERIQEGAAKMQSLLSGMVDYWSTDTSADSRTQLEAALRQALLLAGKQISERRAIVTYDPLPEVMGDFETIATVLRHLIANAIEYCDTPCPRVHVSSKREGLEWVISVQDNGPGIDRAFKERIFGAFRRLHGKEYPGNGLGLAFCKKAVEWHGGRMWMESTPGAGSVFYFTVAAAE